jgi:hypothetical protein
MPQRRFQPVEVPFEAQLHKPRRIDPLTGIFKHQEARYPGQPGGMVETLRQPRSPYINRRTGQVADYALDVNRVVPAYIESVGRLLYDRPAVARAQRMVEAMPQGDPWREYAEKYLKNYTRTDSYPDLQNAWGRLTRFLLRTTTRTLLGFSPKLQTLHLARLVGNAFPEMDARYFRHGVFQVMKHPIESYRQSLEMGILPQARPWNLLRPGDQMDLVLNYMGVADFIDRSVVYIGNRQMYLDRGLPMEEASLRAATDSRRVSFMGSPAHRPLAFRQIPGLEGLLARTMLQFKYVPTAIADQYMRIVGNVAQNPAALGKLMLAIGTLAEAQHLTHFRLLHFIGQTGTAAGGQMYRIFSNLGAAGMALKDGREQEAWSKLEQALKETGYFLMPVGASSSVSMSKGSSRLW